MDDKDKLNVLLAEYNALIIHSVHRAGIAYQIIGFGVAGVAALAAATLWGILGVFLCFITVMLWVVLMDVQTATARIRELEARINADAGETLLVWETERGGMIGRLLKWMAREISRPPR